MSSNSYYPTTFNTTTEQMETTTFNTNDFESNYDSVAKGDLKNYANVNNQNVFTNTNYFSDIFVNSINSVSNTTLGYLTNITEDVQTALTYLTNNVTNLLNNTTGISYDNTNTNIANPLYALSISTNNNVAIGNNCAIAGLLNVTNINNQVLTSNQVNANRIVSSNIVCNGTIQSFSDVGCYLYTVINLPGHGQTTFPSLILIPIMKSNFVSNIFVPTTPFYFIVTLRSKYSIIFLDADGNIIGSLENTTDDFLYNQPFLFQVAPYQLKLFCNNIEL